MSNGIINYLRTFNDCLVLLCIDKKVFEDETKHLSKQQLAEIKLKLIIKVLNNDWIPKLDGKEYCYVPYFKYDSINNSVGDRQGSFSCNRYNIWNSGSKVGFGWGFKTPELAKYCAEQFNKEWNNMLLAK